MTKVSEKFIIILKRSVLIFRENKTVVYNQKFFRRKWEGEVQNLTDAVDEIVTIGDFLAVSEAHVLEDVTQCVQALQNKELDSLDRTAGAIQGTKFF